MEERKQFLDDVCTLMSLVSSCSVCICSSSEHWSVEFLVDNIFESLFVELVNLHSKNYDMSITSRDNKIFVVVRHPDYFPF